MDEKSTAGALSEARAIAEFIRQGFDVYCQFSGKEPWDLVVSKYGSLATVQVKSTKTRSPQDTGWVVQLKRVRSNKTGNKIYNFSKQDCDILAVYIEPIDKIWIRSSDVIDATSSLVIQDKLLEGTARWSATGLEPRGGT